MFERCLYFNSNALTRRINKIWDNAFEEFGLSPAHAYLLRLVLNKPGFSQKEIAKELSLEKSTVTRFIDVLEKKGYLLRKKSGRNQTIVPTALAKNIEHRLNQIGDRLYQRMVNLFGQNDLSEFVAKLRKTTDDLG